MNIKKDDIVVIRRGKDRGTPDKPRTGKVLAVFPSSNRLIVEGINLIGRHTRPSQKNPKGGIVKKEAPIHRSNVALYCKSCSAPAKISQKVLAESDGARRKVRYCSRCGESI
jgi:large subunit ribosomal protein L24